MATRAKPGGSNAATSGSKPEAGIHAALEGLLADLGGVADLQLVIERTFPLPAGHLETIPVPDDFAPQQLLETMRARYGPGSYRVRPYGRSGDTGKMGYLKGAARLSIAPLPTVNPAQPQFAASAPVVIETRGASGADPLSLKLLELFVSQKNPSEGLLRLIGEVATRQQPAAPAGPTTDLMALLKVLERLGVLNTAAKEPADNAGSMERMMMMSIAARIFGPDPNQQQQRPRPRVDPRLDPRAQGRQPPRTRPQVQRPNATPFGPTFAGERPQVEPQVERPQVERPQVERPQAERPQAERPQVERPLEAPVDVDDDDEEVSLEDEIRDHITELAAEDPAAAMQWLAGIFDDLPPALTEQLQHFMQAPTGGQVVNLRRGG